MKSDRDNEIDILLISPERLANERFCEEILPNITAKISLFVIDEAHCISDWGHDFRPHYPLMERYVRKLSKSVRLLATTATANNRVMEDLFAELGRELKILRGDLNPAFPDSPNHTHTQTSAALGVVGTTAGHACWPRHYLHADGRLGPTSRRLA